jgi:hypothetical protein
VVVAGWSSTSPQRWAVGGGGGGAGGLGLSVAGSHGHPPTPKQSSNKNKTCFSKTHQQKSKALDLRLFCDLGYVLENMLLLDATCAFPHTQPAVARAASYWYVASLDP